MKQDDYIWGKETILWGDLPEHTFTVKLLKPFPGKGGCLSLQAHNFKSETWQVISGKGHAIYVAGGEIKSENLYPGDFIKLPTNTIHRLISLSEDFMVLESSTLDKHAQDHTKTKDVIRYHDYHGRACVLPLNTREEQLITACVAITGGVIFNYEKEQALKKAGLLKY